MWLSNIMKAQEKVRFISVWVLSSKCYGSQPPLIDIAVVEEQRYL